MRKITKQAAEAFSNHRNFSKDNTKVTTDGGYVRLFLFGNNIARLNTRTGQREITTCGWNTITTKQRLNGLPGVSIHSEDGSVILNNRKWDGDWIVVNHWEETYAAMYTPTCDVCGHCDNGWFYTLNGRHDYGTKCSACHRKDVSP